MFRRTRAAVFQATLVITSLVLLSHFLSAETFRPQASSSSKSQPSADSRNKTNAPEAPPSDAAVMARAQKLVLNQHKDDEALKEYERIEHHVDLTAAPDPRITDDKIYRIVPTGTGTLKILLKDNNITTDPTEYRRQLQSWQDVLELMLRSNDPRTKTAYEKYDRRNHQRAELVDSIVDSFATQWTGRETRNGRPCDVFELAPKPDFHPRALMQEALTHITAKIWVDRESDEMVRGEAHIMRDISFGGGILGKVYRGGVFSMEQAEVAPGIWEPTRYQYDFGGRKFVFSFDEHEIVEASHYRRVGSPKEALAVVQNELASSQPRAEVP
jgi:hypothetical protein